jgi:hypothetical protein
MIYELNRNLRLSRDDSSITSLYQNSTTWVTLYTEFQANFPLSIQIVVAKLQVRFLTIIKDSELA